MITLIWEKILVTPIKKEEVTTWWLYIWSADKSNETSCWQIFMISDEAKKKYSKETSIAFYPSHCWKEIEYEWNKYLLLDIAQILFFVDK